MITYTKKERGVLHQIDTLIKLKLVLDRFRYPCRKRLRVEGVLCIIFDLLFLHYELN